MLFKASAPGSLMLLGEHAVLHGHSALVCATDKRISVQLTPRTDTKVKLNSSLGTCETDLSQLEPMAPFQFVLATLKKFQKHLKHGCNITVESEFSDQIGLASSAAVTVATLAALSKWLGYAYTSTQSIRHARHIVQSVQGFGSGADVAACTLGGIVAYRMQPLFIKSIMETPALTVVYSGYKTKTTEVVNHIKQQFLPYPKLYKQILQSIGDCAEQGIAAVSRKQWHELGYIMNVQQGLMDALGVNTPLLNTIIEELRSHQDVQGVKISGSGLGDCIVALGSIKNFISKSVQNSKQIFVNITTEGVRCEKI